MYPILRELTMSNEAQERYWINECLNQLDKLGLLQGILYSILFNPLRAWL